MGPGFNAMQNHRELYKRHTIKYIMIVLGAIEKMEEQEQQHWTHKLFVENADLYLLALESMKERALKEVESLCKILDEFGMPRGSKILDLSCGIGRHSIPLAKRGYQVVGYDISPLYIEKAREWAEREGLVVATAANKNNVEVINNIIKFYQGDLRNVAKILSSNSEYNFNAIINMFTSVGYFGEEADFQLFKNLTSISSPDSLFLIETMNRDYLIRELEPFTMSDISERLQLHEKRRLNFENSFMEQEWKFYEKVTLNDTTANFLKLVLDLHFSFRVYSLHELIKLLKEAGWNNILANYGDMITVEPFNRSSNRIVLISKRSKKIEDYQHYKIRVIRNPDEIIKEANAIKERSNELCGCTTSGGMQYSYDYLSEINKKLLDKQKKGEHKGIRYISEINEDNAKIANAFVKSGIQFRHIKNLPPMSFILTDKEMAATIETMKNGNHVQSLLITNEPTYLSHVKNMFEELWKNAIDAVDRIKDIEERKETDYELADVKHYLNEVFEEVNRMKNKAGF
ncbi:MAG TPA: class I SAM-dependent methyltransferase, partial [Nitrososphaeraceae archaeon]|nr:class I SAM-dependent methyltransferase [Nitrososphaeraceae archaeon]